MNSFSDNALTWWGIFAQTFEKGKEPKSGRVYYAPNWQAIDFCFRAYNVRDYAAGIRVLFEFADDLTGPEMPADWILGLEEEDGD